MPRMMCMKYKDIDYHGLSSDSDDFEFIRKEITHSGHYDEYECRFCNLKVKYTYEGDDPIESPIEVHKYYD